MNLGGAIGTEPEPIESRQFSKDVNAAGIGVGGGRKRNESAYPSTPQPPISTVPPVPPTTEDYLVYGMAIWCTKNTWNYYKIQQFHSFCLRQQSQIPLMANLKSLIPSFWTNLMITTALHTKLWQRTLKRV